MEFLKNIRQNSSVKLISIIFITITLLIPLSMVESMIQERSNLRLDAISSIAQRWGGRQTISAPVLAVPYTEKIVENSPPLNGWIPPANMPQKQKVNYIQHIAYLLADSVNISTEMVTEVRYIGIYEVPVYTTKTILRGSFIKQDLKNLAQRYKNLNWRQAKLLLPTSDARNIKSISTVKFAGGNIDFIPPSQTYCFNSIEAGVQLSDTANSDLDFSLTISHAGSSQVNFLPLSRSSNVTLTSDWNSPGFNGAYLPVKRNISNAGFSSEWSVLGLNRSFGQMWNDNTVNSVIFENSEFGVSLYQPADIYQQNIRSVKYAALFIALTFMVFFLFEVFFSLNIHPIQYFFNGGAISTFYLLLLALSEHIHFSIAYLISSAAIVILMAGYSMAILKQTSRGILLGAITAAIYGFLYFIIQSEQNSLLFGAIGFFTVLSTIMYLTRNIDWYNVKGSSKF